MLSDHISLKLDLDDMRKIHDNQQVCLVADCASRFCYSLTSTFVSKGIEFAISGGHFTGSPKYTLAMNIWMYFVSSLHGIR